MSIIIANFATFKSSAGGGYTFVDADADSYYTATALERDGTVYFPSTAQEITGAAMAEAVDNLVIDLKGAGIWAKCNAIYPFIGDTANEHKWNLKDPQDDDASFRLVFTLITHSATGVTGTGSLGSRCETKLIPSSVLTLNDTHLAVYSRTDNSSNGEIGCISTGDAVRLNLFVKTGSNAITEHYNNPSNGFVVAANSNGQGFYVTSRIASNDLALYKNGASIGTQTGSHSGALPTTEIHICGSNGQSASDKNISFASVGGGLTSTEVSDYNTIVQTFETDIFRNV